MFFSVIIPTCNRNDLLARCLVRLLPEVQSLQGVDYEIIVSDDSSGTGAAAMIKEQFPMVQWVAGPRRGPAANRNNGARLAKGEWLVFLDDDCEPEQDLLANYVQAMQYGNAWVLEGRIYTDEALSPLQTAPANLEGGHLWSCNFAILRQTFLEIGMFDEQFKYPNLEDNDLHLRLKNANISVLFLRDASVYHPPRNMPSPRQYARYHESWLYFHHKHGHHKNSIDLLITIFKTRMVAIKQKHKNTASFIALWRLGQELVFTIWESRKWKIKKS